MDKYDGRKLTKQGFIQAMADFFCDGSEFHGQLVPLFIDRLQCFIQVMSKETHYRFYSSSLLLIYEGNINWDDYKEPVTDESNSKKVKPLSTLIDLRFIDFAHTDRTEQLGQDEGLLFGAKNLISILKSLQEHGRSTPVS